MLRGAETKKAVRWFWAWDAEKEERWLEEMARTGWHLVSGGILFRFAKGRPEEVRYRLDWRPARSPELQEYFDLCRDAGWERVCGFNNWHYFRTADAAAPELYTDRTSLVERYRKLTGLIAILGLPNLIFTLLGPDQRTETGGQFRMGLWAVQLALSGLIGSAVFRMWKLIRQLKNGG
jgi:hypothetical protein